MAISQENLDLINQRLNFRNEKLTGNFDEKVKNISEKIANAKDSLNRFYLEEAKKLGITDAVAIQNSGEDLAEYIKNQIRDNEISGTHGTSLWDFNSRNALANDKYRSELGKFSSLTLDIYSEQFGIIESSRNVIKDARKNIESVKQEKEQLIAENERMEREYANSLTAEGRTKELALLDNLQNQIDGEKQTIRNNKEAISLLEGERKKANEQIAKIGKKESDLDTEIAEINKKIKENEDNITRLNEYPKSNTNEIERLKNENSGLQAKKDGLETSKNDLVTAKTRLKDSADKITEANGNIDKSNANIVVFETELGDKLKGVDEKYFEIIKNSKRIDEIEKMDLDKFSAQLDMNEVKLNRSYDELRKSANKLPNEFEKYGIDLVDMQKRRTSKNELPKEEDLKDKEGTKDKEPQNGENKGESKDNKNGTGIPAPKDSSMPAISENQRYDDAKDTIASYIGLDDYNRQNMLEDPENYLNVIDSISYLKGRGASNLGLDFNDSSSITRILKREDLDYSQKLSDDKNKSKIMGMIDNLTNSQLSREEVEDLYENIYSQDKKGTSNILKGKLDGNTKSSLKQMVDNYYSRLNEGNIKGGDEETFNSFFASPLRYANLRNELSSKGILGRLNSWKQAAVDRFSNVSLGDICKSVVNNDRRRLHEPNTRDSFASSLRGGVNEAPVGNSNRDSRGQDRGIQSR